MKRLSCFLVLVLSLGFLAQSREAFAVSSNIVISAIYAGGGQDGATYTNDYVELYNLSGAAVDVTGWKVQYADPSNAFGSDVTLTGSIASHGYLLVGEASGGANGDPLPSPDVIGTADLSSSSGKVRIIDGSAVVIDLLGYGGDADEYETSPGLGDLQNTTALSRKDGGCIDTDNNGTNFEYVQPAQARNSASAVHACSPQSSPTLDPIGDKTVATGSLLSFTVTGSDTDNDPLTFSASNLPAGATFDDADTHQFSWIPQSGQEGTYTNVHFEVSDGVNSTSEDITITVTTGPPNGAPVLDPIGGKSTKPGKPLSFVVTATDPDGDSLAFSASNLPPGASFDPDETHAFSWTPTEADIGTHSGVLFSVSDGEFSDSETITIRVRANRAPVLDPIGPKQVRAKKTLTFVVSALDADGDPLTFSASNLPSGATFDPDTQTFSWKPKRKVPPVNVTFTVTDGEASDEEVVTIKVLRPRRR